jgi:NAD(P)-dependent dehydrogenase (short-subunit alcohol dehydrogenase family)
VSGISQRGFYIERYWSIRIFVWQGGSIVIIASNAAYAPEPPIALYGVTKMALVSLSQALANELGPEGIRVNAVAPGRDWCPVLGTTTATPASPRGNGGILDDRWLGLFHSLLQLAPERSTNVRKGLGVGGGG